MKERNMLRAKSTLKNLKYVPTPEPNLPSMSLISDAHNIRTLPLSHQVSFHLLIVRLSEKRKATDLSPNVCPLSIDRVVKPFCVIRDSTSRRYFSGSLISLNISLEVKIHNAINSDVPLA